MVLTNTFLFADDILAKLMRSALPKKRLRELLAGSDKEVKKSKKRSEEREREVTPVKVEKSKSKRDPSSSNAKPSSSKSKKVETSSEDSSSSSAESSSSSEEEDDELASDADVGSSSGSSRESSPAAPVPEKEDRRGSPIKRAVVRYAPASEPDESELEVVEPPKPKKASSFDAFKDALSSK